MRVVRSEMGFGDELKSFHGAVRVVRVVDVLDEEERRVVGVESDAWEAMAIVAGSDGELACFALGY